MKDLEQISEEEFMLKIIEEIRAYKCALNEIDENLMKIEYYKSKGKIIEYYYNREQDTYTFIPKNKQIGYIQSKGEK